MGYRVVALMGFVSAKTDYYCGSKLFDKLFAKLHRQRRYLCQSRVYIQLLITKTMLNHSPSSYRQAVTLISISTVIYADINSIFYYFIVLKHDNIFKN